jgi:5-methylcytosine-specific restriction protein A
MSDGWHKTSAASRGYDYRWQKTRERILMRDHGLCQICRRSGRITHATEVDHKISKAQGRRRGSAVSIIEGDDNLQALCNDCHKSKTAEEEGRTYAPRVVTGSDGWPK